MGGPVRLDGRWRARPVLFVQAGRRGRQAGQVIPGRLFARSRTASRPSRASDVLERAGVAWPARRQGCRHRHDVRRISAINIIIPGRGRMGGVYVHLLGAETLKSGIPAELGWLLPFLLGLCRRRAWLAPPKRCTAEHHFRDRRVRLAGCALFPRSQHVFVDVTAGPVRRRLRRGEAWAGGASA